MHTMRHIPEVSRYIKWWHYQWNPPLFISFHPCTPPCSGGGKYARDGLRFPPPTVKSAFGRHDLSTAITKSVLIAYFAKIAVLIGK